MQRLGENFELKQAGLSSHARCNSAADPFEHDEHGQLSEHIALFYPSDLLKAMDLEEKNSLQYKIGKTNSNLFSRSLFHVAERIASSAALLLEAILPARGFLVDG